MNWLRREVDVVDGVHAAADGERDYAEPVLPCHKVNSEVDFGGMRVKNRGEVEDQHRWHRLTALAGHPLAQLHSRLVK